VSAAGLTRKIDVPTNPITQIMNERRGVTGNAALRLAYFLARARSFGSILQSLYDLRVAEQKAGKSIKTLPRLKHTSLFTLDRAV